jgi:AAA+ ATPase superfamily predicted ATPase
VESVRNPFFHRGPIRQRDHFFNREHEVGQALGLLRSLQNVALVGQRRMGKTSLLRQLPAHLDEAYLPVFLDGQALGFEGGVAGLLYDIALEIVEALASQGIDGEPPTLDDMAD